MDAERVVEAIRAHLVASGRPFAVVGAYALNALGMARLTDDLDLVAPFEAQEGLIRLLEGLGFETLHRSAGYSNHLHSDLDLGRVDLVYVRGATAEKLFGACRSVPFAGDRAVLVPKAEHLIAMKVHAIKNDPSRRLRDLADIEFLLRLPGVDREEARGYFEKAGLREAWNEVDPQR